MKEQKSDSKILSFKLPATEDLNRDLLKDEAMKGLKRRWGIGVPLFDLDSKCYAFLYCMIRPEF